jgi:hypothetical protein
MGLAAKQKVLEKFTWEMKIDRILEIYRSVLPSPRAPADPASETETKIANAEELK